MAIRLVMNGGEVIIEAAVSDENARKRFPDYVAMKPYLRMTKQPREEATP